MIEFKDVWFKYEDASEYTLRGINLTIKEGELVAILGDNGSGKTTLVKHMNGLLKPTKGKVYIDGIDTVGASISNLSRKVALVFQYPEKMFFSPTVWEEIKNTLRNFEYKENEIEERIKHVLNVFGIDHLRERSPFSLSGGEQRRLSIAIALSWEPKYLVLDEPTTGLDGESRRNLTEAITSVLELKKTVVIVTHDIEYLFEFSPRVILLHRGIILYDGDFKNLITKIEEYTGYGLEPPRITRILKMLERKQNNLDNYTYQDILDYVLRTLGCK